MKSLDKPNISYASFTVRKEKQKNTFIFTTELKFNLKIAYQT